MAGTYKTLNFANRWLQDGMQAWRTVPVFFVTTDVDMSQCKALRMLHSTAEKRMSYAPMLVKATADTLAAHPDLHQMLCHNRTFYPEHVDIALPIGKVNEIAAPTLVIHAANRKTLQEIDLEITSRTPEALNEHEKRLALMEQWGWLVPFGFLRRAIVRYTVANPERRRKFVGTFQISFVPGIDSFGTSMFGTSAILCAGRVREQAVVINHDIVAMPIMTLTCCVDHRVWNGLATSRFLEGVKTRLENGVPAATRTHEPAVTR